MASRTGKIRRMALAVYSGNREKDHGIGVTRSAPVWAIILPLGPPDTALKGFAIFLLFVGIQRKYGLFLKT